MMSIDIDFEVFKELTTRRKTEEHTYNDVLRELLHLNKNQTEKREQQATQPKNHPETHKRGWWTKKTFFPEGTRFRLSHKGDYHYGNVRENGLVLTSTGKKFDSPSGAAIAITGNSVNGWVKWECQIPGKTGWTPIGRIRQERDKRF